MVAAVEEEAPRWDPTIAVATVRLPLNTLLVLRRLKALIGDMFVFLVAC